MSLHIHAATYGKYDFTFYKTIDDSIAIMNSERIGFDYTGYGFIGEKMTSGLYVRFGIQAPYSTLASLFEKKNTNNENKDIKEETEEDTSIDNSLNNTIKNEVKIDELQRDKLSEKKEFRLSFTIGPAFRHMISPSLIWYMGIGVTGIITHSTMSDPTYTASITEVETKLGCDLDFGFRFELNTRTSFRIGAHTTCGILTYTNILYREYGKSSVTEQSLSADIFTPIGGESALSTTGYIGLGHTFKPKNITHYRYSNKTNKLNAGTLTILE